MTTKQKYAHAASYRVQDDHEGEGHVLPSLSGSFQFKAAGGSGADALYAALSQRSHLSGGSGNDVLFGGNMNDSLLGGAGSDALLGGAGDDRLAGDSGNDSLTGGSGNDFIDGGAGWDAAFYGGSVLDYRFSTISHSSASEHDDHLLSVADQRAVEGNDGADTVRKVEELRFLDRTIYLDGRNNVPYAVTDAAYTDEDGSLIFTVTGLLGNDWDFEGGKLSLSAVDAIANGVVSVNSSGSVVFVPDPNFSGAASFSYTIGDGRGGQDTGIVQVMVNAVADAPLLAVSLPDTLPASGFPHVAQTLQVTETESNDSLALANRIARDAFSIAANADLADQNDPSVSIHGVLGSAADRDYFQFSFKAGEQAIFDIDYGKPDVDTVISLYDVSGTLLAINDDMPGTAHALSDHGSMSFLDSWLAYTFAVDGVYTLMVKPYGAGGDYQLNVSIDDATVQKVAPQSFGIDIDAALVDLDGSESLSVILSGLPEDTLLSAGARNRDGNWTLLPAELPGLMVTMPAGVDGFDLVVDAVSIESENGSSAHHVIGGEGNDLIRGGAASDIFTGGAGSDIFSFENDLHYIDRITDFQAGTGGDLLDFRALLAGNVAGEATDSYVHTENTDAGTLVSLAHTGPEANIYPVVLLEGVYAVSSDTLAAQGNLLLH